MNKPKFCHNMLAIAIVFFGQNLAASEGNTNAQLTAQVNEAFEVVQHKLPLVASNITVKVTAEKTPNAHTTCDGAILVSEGLVEALNNSGDPHGALLFVLGHEVGHKLLCNRSAAHSLSAHEEEYFSDFYGSIVARSEDRDGGQKIALEKIAEWEPTKATNAASRAVSSSSHPKIPDRKARLKNIWEEDREKSFGSQYGKFQQARMALENQDVASLVRGTKLMNEVYDFLKDTSNETHGKLASISLIDLTLAKANIKLLSMLLIETETFPLIPVFSFDALFKKEIGKKGTRGRDNCEKQRSPQMHTATSEANKHLQDYIKSFGKDSEAKILLGILSVMDVCADFTNAGLQDNVEAAITALDSALVRTPEFEKTAMFNNKAILTLSRCKTRLALSDCAEDVLADVSASLGQAAQILRNTTPSDRALARIVVFNQAKFYAQLQKNPEKQKEYVTMYNSYMETNSEPSDGLYQLLHKKSAGTVTNNLSEIIPDFFFKKSSEAEAMLKKMGYEVRRHAQESMTSAYNKAGVAVIRIGFDEKSQEILWLDLKAGSGYRLKNIELGKSTIDEAIAQGFSLADRSLITDKTKVFWRTRRQSNVLIYCRFEKNK